jgi:hypothetical protein
MTRGPAPEVDRPIEQREASVEVLTARDAAHAAAEADKAARRAATVAEKSARQAAEEAARVEKIARSLQNGGRRRWRVSGRVSRDSRMNESVQREPEPESEPVTFSDLVRAHRVWELELDKVERRKLESCQKSEQVFRLRWRQFESRYGCIDSVYWSVRDASAVALTLDQRPLRWRPDHETIPRFHRATDWATRDEPDIAAALDECETLAVRVEEILRGPSELIALRRVTAVASHLLGYVDREWFRRAAPHPPPSTSQRAADTAEQKDAKAIRQQECKAFVESQRDELARISRFYHLMGDGQARILTFWGMAEGMVALVVLTGLAVALMWGVTEIEGGAESTDREHLRLFATCVIAGAIGAVLSVLTRMASLGMKFTRKHELGRKNVRWIGVYRPFVGGLFGVAAFLLLASGILQTQDPTGDQKLAYYGILALFSGFFERFTTLGAGGRPTPLEQGDDRSPDEAA